MYENVLVLGVCTKIIHAGPWTIVLPMEDTIICQPRSFICANQWETGILRMPTEKCFAPQSHWSETRKSCLNGGRHCKKKENLMSLLIWSNYLYNEVHAASDSFYTFLGWSAPCIYFPETYDPPTSYCVVLHESQPSNIPSEEYTMYPLSSVSWQGVFSVYSSGQSFQPVM